VQGRPAEHDDLLGLEQRQGQRVQRVGGVRGGGLGDGRQAGQVRMHAGAVAGDDDGVGGEVDLQRLVERHRRGVGPRLAVGPAGRETDGTRARIFQAGHQRLAQRDVELHRAGVGGARPGRGGEHPAGGRAPLRIEGIKSVGGPFGQAQADGRAHLGAEVAQLFEGLVGAGAQQFVGPVGAQHDQRHAGVVGLHDGGAHVGHRGARRHRHAHRRALGQRQADRQEAGGAFVDAHVQAQAPGAVGVGQGEGQRGVT
jgi:hypothetical protein